MDWVGEPGDSGRGGKGAVGGWGWGGGVLIQQSLIFSLAHESLDTTLRRDFAFDRPTVSSRRR